MSLVDLIIWYLLFFFEKSNWFSDISAPKFFGKTLTKFSAIPPPVICDIALISNLLINFSRK